MNLQEAMLQRHSVRQYQDKPLDAWTIQTLKQEIERCNQASGLNIQLITNEPKAFDSFMAHYGKFSGVKHYLALVGKKGPNLEENCGYYGEQLVLKAQQLGLNSCWVAMTYKKIKTAFHVNPGEKLCIVIALGYGKTPGMPHSSKTRKDVVQAQNSLPDWFKNGVDAALLAPTALNQQKFHFSLKDQTVTLQSGRGFYTQIDQGIVRYHFEIGAGQASFTWANPLKRI